MKTTAIIILVILILATGIIIGNLNYYYEPAEEQVFIDLFQELNDAKRHGDVEAVMALEDPERARLLKREIERSPETKKVLELRFRDSALVEYEIERVERRWFEKAYVLSFTGKNAAGEPRTGSVVFTFHEGEWRMSGSAR